MLARFIMAAGNQSDTLNCEHFNATNSSSNADQFAISTSCALFDFTVYTVAMGTLTVLGVLGNVVSFVVLLRDRGRSATSFLLQALGVADTLVLLTAVPLYVLPSVYPFTGRLASYYATYMSLMPVLWPIYLIPYTFTVLVTVLVSMHRYCTVCKPAVMACARISASAAAATRTSRFFPSNAPQARHRVAVLAIFSVIYNIPRFFEYEPGLAIAETVRSVAEILLLRVVYSRDLERCTVLIHTLLYVQLCHISKIFVKAMF